MAAKLQSRDLLNSPPDANPPEVVGAKCSESIVTVAVEPQCLIQLDPEIPTLLESSGLEDTIVTIDSDGDGPRSRGPELYQKQSSANRG